MLLALLFIGATNFRDALSPVDIYLVGGVVRFCTRLLWHHGLLVLLLIGAGVTILAVRVLLSLLLFVMLLLSLMTTVTSLVIRVLLMSCLFFPSAAEAVHWLLARQGSIMHLLLLLVLGHGLHVGGVGERV